MDVSQKILSGEVESNILTIRQLIVQQVNSAHRFMTVATNSLVGIWVLGIVDTYRIGKAIDRV
jgi:hypothetical protein